MGTKRMTPYGVQGVYGTASEIAYINGLGRHKGPGSRSRPIVPDRQTILQLYITNAQNRERWGAVDKDVVIKYAKKLIKNYK